MTDDEATALWNSPRCPRCAALETKLIAALTANKSLKAGTERAFDEIEKLTLENKKLTSALALQASLSKWGQA